MSKLLNYIFGVMVVFLLTSELAKAQQSLLPQPKETHFVYLDSKLKIQYTSEEDNFQAKVVLRMRKDSLIWISISKTGIEGLRILVRQDSIFMIDRLNKEYKSYSYAALSKQLNFDLNYHLIECVLLGNMPLPQFDSIQLSQENNQWLIKQKEKNIQIHNYLGLQNALLEQLVLRDEKSNSSLQLDYGDYNYYGEILFPHNYQINLQYQQEGKNMATKVHINHVKMLFTNEALKFPFNMADKSSQENE